MNQDQYDILTANGWKQLPNDNHMWQLGDNLVLTEENAIMIADSMMGKLSNGHSKDNKSS